MIEARILNVEQLSPDVKSFAVEAITGERMPPALPGSHIDLHLPNGLIRQYSLYEEADGSRYEFAVKHMPDSRGGSRYIHEKVARGDIITISQPRNNFVLGRHPHTLLIAGGIGITPIIAMSQKLATQGRNFALHYFCRDAEAPFKALVDELAAMGCAKRHLGLDPTATAHTLGELLIGGLPAGTHLYVCGPEPLMEETVRLAAPKLGIRAVHLERFSPRSVAVGGTNRAFTVKLAREQAASCVRLLQSCLA